MDDEANARRYPWARHVLGLAPVFALVASITAYAGSEQGVEDLFFACREAWPELVPYVEFFSDYANLFYYAVYVAILAYGVKRGNDALAGFALGYVAALLATLALVDVCKFTFGRPRPWSDDPVEYFTGDSDNHSFPSGHAAETITTALPLGLRFGKIVLPLLVGLSPALISLSRLYLGQHHPSDMAGSMIVGSLGVYLAWRFAAPGTRLVRWVRRRPSVDAS